MVRLLTCDGVWIERDITIEEITILVMANKVLMEPSIKRSASYKIMNSTHDTPDKGRVRTGSVTRFVNGIN